MTSQGSSESFTSHDFNITDNASVHKDPHQLNQSSRSTITSVTSRSAKATHTASQSDRESKLSKNETIGTGIVVGIACCIFIALAIGLVVHNRAPRSSRAENPGDVDPEAEKRFGPDGNDEQTSKAENDHQSGPSLTIGGGIVHASYEVRGDEAANELDAGPRIHELPSPISPILQAWVYCMKFESDLWGFHRNEISYSGEAQFGFLCTIWMYSGYIALHKQHHTCILATRHGIWAVTRFRELRRSIFVPFKFLRSNCPRAPSI